MGKKKQNNSEPCSAKSGLNSLQTYKILDQFNFEAIADNTLYVTEKLNFVLERVDNIAGKGENSGYQNFLLFPQCFQKTVFSGL